MAQLKFLASSQVDWQGERVDVRNGRPANHTEQDHYARYISATKFVSGNVLDIACGTGHGAEVLSKVATMVVGIDNNATAIEWARNRLPRCEFLLASVPPIPLADSSFQAVACFETVEHIEDDQGFLTELHRVLTREGTLLLSTPNKDVTSQDGPPTNQWHVREYGLNELRTLVAGAGFTNIELFGQRSLDDRRSRHQFALRLVARFPALCQPGRWWDRLAHGDGQVVPWGEPPWKATYWVLKAQRG